MLDKKRIIIFSIIIVSAIQIVYAKNTKIRIGWQTSWATQGQIAVLLKNTNILELNNLDADFIGFSYGGPLNEGALSGDVDVIFTADQPACMLLARGAKWKIIGRLIYNRVGTIVPVDSKINNIIDLKGQSIGIPFGAAAQRETLKALTENGLDPDKDVAIKNIGIYEQINVIQAGDDSSWGDFAAFSSWDPPMAELEYMKKARAVDYGLVTAVIVMSENFMKKNPEAVVGFLKSYITAFYYYAKNQEKANMMFKEESKLNFDLDVLDIAASVEPNIEVKNIQDVNISLSDKDIEVIQSGADFIYNQKLTDNHLKNVKKYIDLSFLEKAEEEIKAIKKMKLLKIKINKSK